MAIFITVSSVGQKLLLYWSLYGFTRSIAPIRTRVYISICSGSGSPKWNVLVTSSVAKRCKNDHSVDIFRIKCCEKILTGGENSPRFKFQEKIKKCQKRFSIFFLEPGKTFSKILSLNKILSFQIVCSLLARFCT